MLDTVATLRRVYMRVVFVLVSALGFVAAAAFVPDVVLRFGGRVVAGSATMLLVGPLFWLAAGVLALAKQSVPSASGLTEENGTASDVIKRLNANVGVREALVIAGPLVACALLAVGIGSFASPSINLMTTDTTGNVYLQTGERVLVSDPSGHLLAEIRLDDARIKVRGLTEMRATDPEHVYLADSDEAVVHVVGRGVQATQFDVAAVTPNPAMLALALSESGPLVVGADTVLLCSEAGPRRLYSNPELRFPSGLECAAGGTLFVADSDNSRILEVRDGDVVRTITMDEGFREMVHPTELRLAKDGAIYAIARKRDAVAVPVYWRGLVGVAGPTDTTLSLRELRWRGRAMDVLQCSLLPDGRLMYVPLGYEAVMVADAEGESEQWAPGRMRGRLRLLAWGSLLVDWGPALLVIVGVALSILGFAKALAWAVVMPPISDEGGRT